MPDDLHAAEAQSERGADFETEDLGLRRDVSLLGALVGDVVRAQEGEELFARVETARKAAIARREGEGDRAALERSVAGLDADTARSLVRAFGLYFQVVNLAERLHRVRRRTAYRRAGRPQPGGLRDVLARLRADGVGDAELRDELGALLVEPVFTAHPTEATRRTLLELEQRMARRLLQVLDGHPSELEEEETRRRIRTELAVSWQTEPSPHERPTVADEREHVLFYVNDVLYRIVPDFYEDLAAALAETAGSGEAAGEAEAVDPVELPIVLRFASWVGGDMDGNPNVDASTIRETLARHRALILGRYREDLRRLAELLSHSKSRTEFLPAIERRIEEYRALFPDEHEAIRPRHLEMPYRVLLRLMVARLEATHADREVEAYPSWRELAADLELISESLGAARGEHAGKERVDRVRLRVRTFGFHLATLDVRQDSLVHRRVVGELLGFGGESEEWLGLAAADRCSHITRALRDGWARPKQWSEEAERTRKVFVAIATCRRRYGESAVGPFVLSMARDADDVLSVLLLARWGALEEDGRVPLDVAPLFETVPDLEAAPDVLRRLFDDDLYWAHLEERGERQMVMIGYSDSNKDGGFLSSRWALQQGQARLVDVCEERGVVLTLFHGRGGTISRGGGKAHEAVLASPRGAVRGGLRMTEQGEVIHAKYGLRGIALRELGRTSAAVLLESLRPAEPAAAIEEWRGLMERMAARSREVYRRLVYEDADFYEYFQGATPIDVITRMRIGSRPAARRSKQGVENLRAIPWVFSWTQSRHILPGWYGLGSGLEAGLEAAGEETLRALVAGWPFAQVLLSDAEMVLGKTDLDIAARYAELAGAAGERLFPVIRAEFDRTVELLLRVTGSPELLAEEHKLARAIRLRNPYVDPMSLLQVDLLRQWRAGDREDEELFEALLETVNGIARGLQNTG